MLYFSQMKFARYFSFFIFWAMAIFPFNSFGGTYHREDSTQIKVVTYNIRYSNPADSLNSWDNRKVAIIAQMRAFDADFIGIQEGLYSQVKEMDSLLGDEWQWLGVGRDDGQFKGEFSALFYRSDRFKVLMENTFWLSPTPNQPSKGWDAALPRIVTFGQFEHRKTHNKWMVFNTHFDHVGNIARNESVKLIYSKMKPWIKEGIPVLLTGDFNLPPHSKPIQWLSKKLNDTHVKMHALNDVRGTFNGFSKQIQSGPRIDYIFYSHVLQCLNYQVDYQVRGPYLYYSDHYPIISTFKTP